MLTALPYSLDRAFSRLTDSEQAASRMSRLVSRVGKVRFQSNDSSLARGNLRPAAGPRPCCFQLSRKPEECSLLPKSRYKMHSDG